MGKFSALKSNGYTNEHEAFSQALEESGKISTELPFLKATKNPWEIWLNSLKEKYREPVERYFEMFKNWLKEVFGDEGLDVGAVDWSFYFMLISLILMSAVVSFAVIMLYRYFMSKDYSSKDLSKGPNKIVSIEEILLDQINQMLKSQQWAEASRLRWGLFLERKNLNHEMTPYEYEKSQKNIQGLKASELYEKMFYEPAADKKWFKEYNMNLKKIEGQS